MPTVRTLVVRWRTRSRGTAPAPDTIVLGLPRGGVAVAFEVAHALALPLDVLVVRKLGLPQQPELAMGAIASGGALVVNDEVMRDLGGESRPSRPFVPASKSSSNGASATIAGRDHRSK